MATRENEFGDLSDDELQDRIREAEEIIDLVKDRPQQSGALEFGARDMLEALRAEEQRRKTN